MTTPAKTLVVDDEASVRFFLEELLTRDGHQVTAVDSGEAALARLAAEEFDLALIDVKLPGVSGMDVLAAIRQKLSDAAVIMLTAHASLNTAIEALRQGAHDYLFKPCTTMELRESVRTGLLKRQHQIQQRQLLAQIAQQLNQDLTQAAIAPAPAGGPELANDPARFVQYGKWIVDLMRHVITLDGHVLELSPTEFALLAYLAAEAPRVVSARELVRAAQGYEAEDWEARDIVRYHIYRVRYKAQHVAGSADCIRTVRGVGYTLAD